MPEKKFSGVEIQICPIYYHTWGCPVFFLEAPLQEGSSGLTKWEPREITRVYLGNSPFHAGSLAVVLNTINGHVSPQYHVVFDNILSTVDHMKKGTVPRNWKTL